MKKHILVLGRRGVGKTRFINTYSVLHREFRCTFLEAPSIYPQKDSVICNGLILLIDGDFDKSKDYVENDLAKIFAGLENFPRENVAFVILHQQQNFRETLDIIEIIFEPSDGSVFVLDSFRPDRRLIDYLLYLNRTNNEFRFNLCLDGVSVLQVIGNIFEALIDALYCLEENLKLLKENHKERKLLKVYRHRAELAPLSITIMKCDLTTFCKNCLSELCYIRSDNLDEIQVNGVQVINANEFCAKCACPSSEHIRRIFSPQIESLRFPNHDYRVEYNTEERRILHLLVNLYIFSQQNCTEVLPQYLKDFNNRTLWSQVRRTYVEDKIYQRIEAEIAGRSNNININEVVKYITDFMDVSQHFHSLKINKEIIDNYLRPTYNLQIIQNKEATNRLLGLNFKRKVTTYRPYKGYKQKHGNNSEMVWLEYINTSHGINSRIDTKPTNKSDVQTQEENSDDLMSLEFVNNSTYKKQGAIRKEGPKGKNTPTARNSNSNMEWLEYLNPSLGINSKIDTKSTNKSDMQTQEAKSDGLMSLEFVNTSTYKKQGAIPKEPPKDKITPAGTIQTAKKSPNANQIENAINIKTLITAISEIRSELGEIKKFITNSGGRSSLGTISDSDVKSGDASSVLEALQAIRGELSDLKAAGDPCKDLTDLKKLVKGIETNQATLIRNSAELKLQIDDLANCNKCGADENFHNPNDNSKKLCDDNKELNWNILN